MNKIVIILAGASLLLWNTQKHKQGVFGNQLFPIAYFEGLSD
jgi:hypothetical protein